MPWRQIKCRERRAALKFGCSTSATLKCPRNTLPCKYSGVSGQLPHGRFERLDRPVVSGCADAEPVSPPSTSQKNVAHATASDALVHNSWCKPPHREEVYEASGETRQTGGV